MRTKLIAGAPRNIWTLPLTEGLRGHAEIELHYAEPELLREQLAAGEIDCALLSPVDAVMIDHARVVPGLALCVNAAGVGPWWVDEEKNGNEAATGFGRELFALFQSGKIDNGEDGAVISHGTLAPFGGGLAGDLPAHDLAGAWLQTTELPWVAAVWTIAPGAPIVQLRRIVAIAAREEIDFKKLGDEFGDLDEKWVKNHAENTVYYTLGSREMSSIQQLLERATEVGLCAESARFRLC